MGMEYLTIDTLSPKEHKRIFKSISIDPSTQCWNWTGSLDGQGYGLVWFRRRTERIHRVIFAWKVMPIPRGDACRFAQLDHKVCQNRKCCNPEHLELVTHQVNTTRGIGPSGINARKTHCIRGHLLVTVSNGRRRDCRVCQNLRQKALLQGPKREYWLEKRRQASRRYYERKKEQPE